MIKPAPVAVATALASKAAAELPKKPAEEAPKVASETSKVQSPPPVKEAPAKASAPSPAILTLSEISYHSSKVYSTPAHLATYGGEIAFNVTSSNPAVPGIQSCYARGLHLNDMFYGELNYTCDSTTPGVVTNFTFSTPGSLFTINQTWSEDG